MSEFTYTVFVVIASMVGALISLFVVVIAAALLPESPPPVRPTAETNVDSNAQYRTAA